MLYLPELLSLIPGERHVYATKVDWTGSGPGVLTLDFSDPAAPTAGHFLEIPYLYAQSGAIVGDVLYLGETDGGLLACDIRDPDIPTILSAWGAAGNLYDLFAMPTSDGPVLVTASWGSGLEIVPLQVRAGSVASTPVSVSSATVRAFPNPFNPRCEIAFTLLRAGMTTITIYDVAGRRVADLVRNEHLAAGPQAFGWNGRDLRGREAASGVYFARVSGPEIDEVKKLVLAR
jgi:hypothetical protein